MPDGEELRLHTKVITRVTVTITMSSCIIQILHVMPRKLLLFVLFEPALSRISRWDKASSPDFIFIWCRGYPSHL